MHLTPQRLATISQGFTLIEILVVIAISTILLTISIASLNTLSTRTVQTEGAHVVLGALQEAHARTLSSHNDDTYGVYFSSNEVVIFKGTTYVPGDADNDVRPLPSRAEVSDISLGIGGTSVLFERLSGNANSSGTITIRSLRDTNASSTILIYESGLSEIRP